MTIDVPTLDAFFRGAVGSTGVLVGGALALGFRHGIDWDHIAAITDIMSTTSSAVIRNGSRPGTQQGRDGLLQSTRSTLTTDVDDQVTTAATAGPLRHYFALQHRPFLLGSLYALGHAAVVTALGLLAIVASEFLPDWIDPLMGRVVGVTLIVLSGYLFFSLYQYIRGGEFHLRSRWMLVFAAVRRGYGALMTKLLKRRHHEHTHDVQQYGARTAFGVGLIHGIGAETGTQALVIATVVGATSKTSAIVVLLAFVVGLLISNSLITIAATTGFISSQRRQWLYAAAGLVAAVFSLVVGVMFVLGADATIPDLGRFFGWVGGQET
ncbi:MAG: hypothetical protein EXR68_02195 [Dehalococcoidia bacterium]|nr:hypothetical protein [Dehalococcoidia bacterium]